MILATFDGALLALATVLVPAVAVGLPLYVSSRKGRRKLSEQIGQPRENGSLTGDVEQFKGEVRYRFGSTDEHLERLDRGHDELRAGQAEITNALAQLTGALTAARSDLAGLSALVGELNDLHKPAAPAATDPIEE